MCTSVMRVYKCSPKYPVCSAHAPIILSFVACPAVQYKQYYPKKGNILENKVNEHKTNVLIFRLLEIFFIL